MKDEFAPLMSPKTRTETRPARRCVTCCVVATLAVVAIAHARGVHRAVRLQRNKGSLQLFWDDGDRAAREATVAAEAGRLGARCDDTFDASAHAPAMTDHEIAAMVKYVRGKHPGATWGEGEALYLEWGSGGSTALFGTAARKTFTVEHAVEWCDQVREWPETKCMAESNRWEMYCHDAGHPLEAWGYPDGSGYSAAKDSPSFHPAFHAAMRRYTQAPARFGVTAYDVVLIDGRFRNACAFAILPYLHQGSVVAWHDWEPDDFLALRSDVKVRGHETPKSPTHRMYHKAAGRLFTLVERVDRLAVFTVDPAVYDAVQSMA